MNRCWAINVTNLHRCGRKGDWRFFCHEHKKQPFVWGFTFIFTVLAGSASIYSLIRDVFPGDELIVTTSTPNEHRLTAPTTYHGHRQAEIFSKPISASEYLLQYKGDGDIAFEHYNLESKPNLVALLNDINANRIEYPKRAIDILVLQENLDSGNLRLVFAAAEQISEKQTALRKMTQAASNE